MKILEALNWRYGVKQFSEEKLNTADVKALLDMTRLSASAYGLQPYTILGNLLTCAAAMQIGSCPMTGFDRAGYYAELKLKEKGLTATVICPIGHRHPEDTQAFSPKVRFDYDDIVMVV